MNYSRRYQPKKVQTINHVQWLKFILLTLGALLVARLFYVQIVRHDYYQAQAYAEHIKKFEINAPRGIIKMLDGNSSIPVVLNEIRYTIYADPQYITDARETAASLIKIIGGNQEDLRKKLETSDSRYIVLAKKMTREQAEKIDKLALSGIGKKEIHMRTYPQGNLAAQVLGFVNDDGRGQYGIEEYANGTLAGRIGLEKAVTDVWGIPLAVNNDNILKPAVPGKAITLTIDLGMQKMAEDSLKSAVDSTKAIKGNVIIMEAHTGAIKVMANYPSYDPSTFDKIDDISVFINPAVSYTWEPGSVMKPLLVSAAFTEGTLQPDSTYYDAGYVQVDDRKITNAFNYGAQTMTVRDIINKSLNTGAVYVLQSMGGGSINTQARNTWHKYLTEHYRLDHLTGIEQSGEVTGYISNPTDGDGLTVRYANMAFGQGISITPIQLVAAFGAIMNGGTYYQPTLIASTTETEGKQQLKEPKVVATNIISAAASADIIAMTKNALEINYPSIIKDGYDLGGKSGTAQVADGQGGYKKDLYIGTYIGYIGSGGQVKYIMMIRLDEPKTASLASYEAAKVWGKLAGDFIDGFAIAANSP